MKTHKLMVSLAVLVFFASPCLADGETSKALAKVAEQASGALAMLRYTVEQEDGGQTATAAGPAICINPNGMFMTTALDPRFRVEALKDFELVVPGVEGKTVKAKLLGIDSVTGMGFVQATEPHTWKAIKFQRDSNLKVGQLVISAGMMQNDQRLPIYVGAAHVSAMLRTPASLVYVTAGNLTTVCSPVFTADGNAVGIVGSNQPYLSCQTLTSRGPASLLIRGLQETAFFTPVEEFVHVMGNIPTSGQIRRPPWMGARFGTFTKQDADLKKLSQPGVKIVQVFPGHPAAKMGIKDMDVVLGINGKQIERMASPELTAQNFEMQLLRFGIGESVSLEVLSGETKQTVKVTLTAMPTLPAEALRLSIQSLGFAVREKVALDRYLEKGPTAEMDGLIVIGVDPNSPAGRDGGLLKDDLVLKLNGSAVTTVAKFKEIMESAIKTNPSAPLEFVVQRGNQAQQIDIRPPALR